MLYKDPEHTHRKVTLEEMMSCLSKILDHLSDLIDVEKRRIYDVVNILEAF